MSAKHVKVQLHKAHRPAMEKVRDQTGLSFNQIINHIFARSTMELAALVKAHKKG